MSVKYLGTEDSVNVCDCCGRSGLKKTVALDFNGVKRNLGTSCAGRAIGRTTRSVADVKQAVKQDNELDIIKKKVLGLILSGENVVYGRFYISEGSLKAKLMIAEPSGRMIKQIFPKSNKDIHPST